MTLGPLSCSRRHPSDIINCSRPEAHPKDLWGKWRYEYKCRYEYKMQHCPSGNQHIQETIMLLSCGGAFRSSVEKYDEGSDKFSEWKTSGWGTWNVNAEGEIVITCSTVTTSSGSRDVRQDDEQSGRVSEYSSESQLHESYADFLSRYKWQRSLFEMEEYRLRIQIRQTLELSKATPHTPMDSATYTQLPDISRCHVRCASTSSSRSIHTLVAHKGLRTMLSRSRRQC